MHNTDYTTELKEGVARLSIQRVYPEDEGEYTCVAYNQLGKDSSAACLIVDGNSNNCFLNIYFYTCNQILLDVRKEFLDHLNWQLLKLPIK